MAITSTDNRVQYTSTGTTGPYPFPFPVVAGGFTVIITDPDPLIGDTVLSAGQYTASYVDNDPEQGGSITTNVAPTAGFMVTILRTTPQTQEDEFYNGQPTLYSSLEDAVDQLTMEVQDLQGQLYRTPMLKETTPLGPQVLPDPIQLQYLQWNPIGTELQNGPLTVNITSSGATTLHYLSNYASFAAALTALGNSTYSTLIIDTGAVVAVNSIISPNIEIICTKMGGFAIAQTVTLTINGAFSAGTYQVFSGLGSVVFGMAPAGGILPEWWQNNTVPGTTDMAAATQAAINSIGRIPYTHGHASGAQVVLSSSAYLWGTSIDMTERDSITLSGKGNGYLGPNITSTTADYIIDMTSALMCRLENMRILSTTARVGIFNNRGTGNPYSFWNNFHNLYVHLGTNPSVNGGIGSIAYYTCRGENAQSHNCLYEGDVGSYANITPDLSVFPSSFTTVNNTIHSMEMVSFYDCTIRSLGTYNYPEILIGVLGFEHHNCVWAQAGDTAGTSGTANGAVETTEISHSFFTGQVESVAGPFAYVHAGMYFSSMDIITSSSMWTTAGLVNLDTASSILYGNTIKMQISGTPSVITPVVNQRNPAAQISGNTIISTSGSDYVHTIDAAEGARTPQFPSLVANVSNNVEITHNTGTVPGKIITDNIRRFSVLGIPVANGISFWYYPPDNVGMMKITACHYGLSGGECENLVVMATRLGDGTAVGIVPLVDEIVGTANRLTASYTAGPPKAIVFTTSANTGDVYIWYEVEEVYGSTS